MNSRISCSLPYSAQIGFLSLVLTVAPGCSGGDVNDDRLSQDSESDSVAHAGSSSSGGWSGLWIDENGVHLQFREDGRFATFRLNEAVSDLRFHEVGENKYGERTIPTLQRTDGWDLEDGKLVSFKRPADPARADERTAGRSFRRMTPEEELAYWDASSFRLVRQGRLDEIRAAEAAGFDFSKVVDSGITVAAEGQNVFVDMLAYAVKAKQLDVVRHFLESDFVLHSPDVDLDAIKLNDPQILGELIDHGLPVQKALTDAIVNDASPSLFEVLFDKGAIADNEHLGLIDSAMDQNKVAVRSLFEARLTD